MCDGVGEGWYGLNGEVSECCTGDCEVFGGVEGKAGSFGKSVGLCVGL